MRILASICLFLAALLWLLDHFVVVKQYPLIRASLGFTILAVALFQFGERLLD